MSTANNDVSAIIYIFVNTYNCTQVKNRGQISDYSYLGITLENMTILLKFKNAFKLNNLN